MDERSSDVEKGSDEVMLPGFRFHPTDEELVSFYLKRKVQQEPLAVELIRQLDIYKFDPWDLPKLATTGEKEWYFYCPRDRKYRNSTRPNRVTGAGFWKATGTDRPIYSSEGSSRCIGLKKSLVFYKGRAAKGTKTDWMMHEYRLPSLTRSSLSPFKTPTDHSTVPANESWAICRIFKKTNSAARRAMSYSWVSPAQACINSSLQQLQEENNNTVSFPLLDFSSLCKPPPNAEIHTGCFVSPSPFEMQMPSSSPLPASSMNATSVRFDLPPMVPGDLFEQHQQQYCNSKFAVGNLPVDTSASFRDEVEDYLPLNKIASLDLPFSGLQTGLFSEWKPSLLLCGSPPYNSEILTSYLAN